MRKILEQFLFVIFLSHLMHFCTNPDRYAKKQKEFFYKDIEKQFNEIPSKHSPLILSPGLTSPFQIFALPGSDYFIISDDSNWKIFLLDSNGHVLSEAGGYGRGPGEFEVINKVHIDHDQYIYILDIRQRRINIFEVNNEELIYYNTIALNYDEQMTLVDFHLSGDNIYGFFNRIEDYQTWENRYYLFRMDDDFHPVDELLVLPGNEKVQISNFVYIDNPVGRLTLWDFEGDRLFYTDSHSSVIQQFHLITNTGEELTDLSLGERQNHSDLIDLLKQSMRDLVENRPEISEAIENADVLPIFQSFLVQEEYIYLGIYYINQDYRLILFFNQETKNMGYIKIPPEIYHFASNGRLIYAVGSKSSGERQLIKINLHEEIK